MKRALIVGAGGSGFLHALALRSAGVRIAHVYDPDEERAHWLSALTGAVPIDAFDAAVDADVVAICSPPHWHVEQAIALSRPGRMVFLEKPVALTESGLEALAGLPSAVPVLQWRAGRTARQLRAAFADHVFGSRPQIQCELRLWRDAAYFDARADWGCGAMLSIGVHALDLIVWMVGRPIARVVRTESMGRRGLAVMTRGNVEIEFDDGTRALVRITLDSEGHSDFSLFVRGEHASVELRGSEADPTAFPARWRGAIPSAVAGATGSPLLVPFIHEALRGVAPTIRDVRRAHALAM
jgi:predicted dehydrogenase